MIGRLIRLELNIWRSLLFWIVRYKPGVGPGARTFPYARELAPLIGVFIFVSAIELVAVHLLLPWETVRLILDIVSLWGLLWMFGLLASMKVFPHVLDDEGLRLRHGFHEDVRVPWTAVQSVRARRGSVKAKGNLLVAGDVLSLPVLKQTRVDVTLTGPTRVGPAEVTHVHFYVNDARAFVAAVREQLATVGS